MREIDKIIVHCSATKEGVDVSASTIDSWHKERGWRGIGYHYVIALDGKIEYGRNVNETGAHVRNHNRRSIGIELEQKYCDIGIKRLNLLQIKFDL